jgi:hypothetical protein
VIVHARGETQFPWAFSLGSADGCHHLTGRRGAEKKILKKFSKISQKSFKNPLTPI